MSEAIITYTTRYIIGVNIEDYSVYPDNRRKDLLSYLNNKKDNNGEKLKSRGTATHQNFENLLKELSKQYEDLGMIIYGTGEDATDSWYIICRNGELLKKASLNAEMILPKLGGLQFRAGVVWFRHPNYDDVVSLD